MYKISELMSVSFDVAKEIVNKVDYELLAGKESFGYGYVQYKEINTLNMRESAMWVTLYCLNVVNIEDVVNTQDKIAELIYGQTDLCTLQSIFKLTKQILGQQGDMLDFSNIEECNVDIDSNEEAESNVNKACTSMSKKVDDYHKRFNVIPDVNWLPILGSSLLRKASSLFTEVVEMLMRVQEVLCNKGLKGLDIQCKRGDCERLDKIKQFIINQKDISGKVIRYFVYLFVIYDEYCIYNHSTKCVSECNVGEWLDIVFESVIHHLVNLSYDRLGV